MTAAPMPATATNRPRTAANTPVNAHGTPLVNRNLLKQQEPHWQEHGYRCVAAGVLHERAGDSPVW
ncbi:MAG: hypothetical protein JNM62_10120 [Flavobacteriales bacterium]|nr:hypothetical protein [Flavobacteriales bacterium]